MKTDFIKNMNLGFALLAGCVLALAFPVLPVLPGTVAAETAAANIHTISGAAPSTCRLSHTRRGRTPRSAK